MAIEMLGIWIILVEYLEWLLGIFMLNDLNLSLYLPIKIKNQSNIFFAVENETAKKTQPAFNKSVDLEALRSLDPENDEASAFEFGISRGVAAIQIEEAMAERKIPPLKPILNDPSAPLSTTMKRILIVSTWRTGSSFLGDLILSAPSVFYSYEPLHFIDEKFTQLPSTLK